MQGNFLLQLAESSYVMPLFVEQEVGLVKCKLLVRMLRNVRRKMGKMKSKRILDEEEDETNETRNETKKDNMNEATNEAMNENVRMDMSHARFRISKYVLCLPQTQSKTLS